MRVAMAQGGHSDLRPRRVIVDAMNVIGSQPDGWWRDRAGAQRRLAARIDALVAARPVGGAVEVTVVFEGKPVEDLGEGPHGDLLVLWARRRGRDAADDRIVEETAASHAPVTVVTSDRALRDRVRRLGAIVVGPSGLADAVTAKP